MLGSIWNLLTTENAKLTSLVISPTIFIEAYLDFKIFTLILNLEYTKRQKILYIIFMSIISKIAEFIIPMPYNIILNYLSMLVLIKMVFKINIIESILCVILPTVVFALIGNLILNPILKTLNINLTQANVIPFYRLIYLLCSYFICFVFTLVLRIIPRKVNLSLNLIKNLDNRSKNVIILNLILGLITIFIQILITFYYINTYSIIFTLLNFVSLFAYFSISFYSLTKTMRLQITTQNLESAENYNTTLSYLYDNVKAFHHDFDNMLFIIGGFIDNNDMDGLKKYYKNLEKDGERVNNIALLNPKLINNSGIYNLLMSKYKKAHDANVEVKLEFFFDFDRLKMPIYEFSRILGILLDNSIEAASESQEKHIHIIFRDSNKNKTQIISIENTYNNKDVNIDKIFEKGVTGKDNHTGMGLWEVNQILKRNNNVTLHTENDETFFKQTLEIYY